MLPRNLVLIWFSLESCADLVLSRKLCEWQPVFRKVVRVETRS